MNLRPMQSSFPSLRAALLIFGAFSVARAARAQDSEPVPVEVAPEKPVKATSTPTSASVTPAPSSESGGGLIERLPPSAYPEPVTRGLYGGSLWSTFHGLQWPYYPQNGIGVSGYAWLDQDYERIKVGAPTQQNIKEILQQGRLLLRITPTYSHAGWFVQGQAELVANKDQTQAQPAAADTDDLWIRAGKWQTWDVTVGRFEAFEVYHLGMGLDLNTEERIGAHDATGAPPGLYGASFLFYRPGSTGNVAFHVFPNENLRFELLTQIGNDGGLNARGVRPAAVLDLGWFKLKAAAEYQLETSKFAGDKTRKENRGFAGSAQFVFDPYIEFGANAGYALVDVSDNVGNPNTEASKTTKSFGGFLNARLVPDLLLGLGVNDVRQDDTHLDSDGNVGHFSHTQAFAALQYYLARQIQIKLVGAYAKGEFNPTFSVTGPYQNIMYSGRLRVMYLF